MIVVIDNYDSFVFNIARYLCELGREVTVVRNDAVDVEGLAAMHPSAVVLSPGPCTPREAGISCDVVRAFSGRVPLLGICLGHQCIGEVFGGQVVRARVPMHGRAAPALHEGEGLFAGLPQPLAVGRYHSLIVTLDDEAGPLRVTARSPEGEIMALAHRAHPTYGIQFHPESVLTPQGKALLANFLAAAERFAANGEGICSS
ncbi:glutamine amidotransferase of anthranilate synthase or aminodeoxychorismate synthase [Chelatococcus sambhunathii]|uniref:Aminodeoxychorismate/anthranilate synthase component II n=2 Tax=Chelatococcus TaxID=28209 RepID=A0AAC9NXL5_9HYPH|nr:MULTISPECIES: aminodeoxychorismate/anthranilate synthase component II [Chelatococcus]APF36619.1 aminodeoxychorismate/anthranilate synthase component II [Chelatococcus daeguensis]CUA90792.1 glutamine amidotransferase of anthranilate synthase or aminodeoxychorismate synthase [Chelatococcus sambhunathii]